MNNLPMYKKLLLFFAFWGLMGSAFAQDTPGAPKKEAAKFVREKTWGQGLKPDVYADVNKAEFALQYMKNKAVWDKAFAFLRDSDLANLTPGKHAIDGDDAYATVTDAPEKDFDKTAWESHRKYIDLQYVIRGKEKIGRADVATATVIKPYDDTKDLANYTADGKFYIADPDTFYLFFPGDAHRPNIKVDDFDVVKKIVIKIKVVE